MQLTDTMQAPRVLSSSRFFLTSYLPTYAAAVFLLILIWAGAPDRRVDFDRAWRTASHLSGVQVLLIAVAVSLAAVLLQPFQLAIVRVLEGGFPRWLGSGLGRRAQLGFKHYREGKIQRQIDNAVKLTSPDVAVERRVLIQDAGARSARLRARYPAPDHLVRGTALGNVLAAMEDNAGAAYSLDAAVMWPRLYPLLNDKVRAVVDDLRNGMDAAARLAATGVVAAVVAFLLLVWRSGWLTLLSLVPVAVAVVAYFGAVQAAVAYAVAVSVAFDLQRFDLLRALRLETPDEIDHEKEGNEALSDFLRQGIPVPFRYVDSGGE